MRHYYTSVRITLIDRDVPSYFQSLEHLLRAKLMARVGEGFPLECPACGGDIRLIAFITEPEPIQKILTHLGESLEPPPVLPVRGPPTDWGELVQAHDDRDVFQASLADLPVIDIHCLCGNPDARHQRRRSETDRGKTTRRRHKIPPQRCNAGVRGPPPQARAAP